MTAKNEADQVPDLLLIGVLKNKMNQPTQPLALSNITIGSVGVLSPASRKKEHAKWETQNRIYRQARMPWANRQTISRESLLVNRTLNLTDGNSK